MLTPSLAPSSDFYKPHGESNLTSMDAALLVPSRVLPEEAGYLAGVARLQCGFRASPSRCGPLMPDGAAGAVLRWAARGGLRTSSTTGAAYRDPQLEPVHTEPEDIQWFALALTAGTDKAARASVLWPEQVLQAGESKATAARIRCQEVGAAHLPGVPIAIAGRPLPLVAAKGAEQTPRTPASGGPLLGAVACLDGTVHALLALPPGASHGGASPSTEPLLPLRLVVAPLGASHCGYASQLAWSGDGTWLASGG